MLSTSMIRVATYNMEADINGVSTPRSGSYQVLEGIGEEKVQGNVRPIDILTLEETTSNSTTVAPIVSNLNSYYSGAAVYAQSSYQATEEGGDNADGNGPNAVIYNTLTLNLVASVGVGTPQGSNNGEYRQVVRYEFQPVGDTGSNGIFYIYVSHMKSLSSGSDSTDEQYQLEEAKIILQDETTLPANSSVLYTGDLNSDNSDTAIPYMESSVPGEAYDPLGGAYSSKVDESDSSTSLNYRDDYELMTAPVYHDTGALDYITGSYHTFGNNGSVSDPASSSNTALNSDLVQDGGTFISASTLYSDLGTASDHLPVVADYTLSGGSTSGSPTIGGFSASPSTVNAGSSVTLTASNVVESGGTGTVTGVNFYRESNGTSGLQIGSDTLVGSGTENGSTWTLNASTSGLAAGSQTFYAVATDSNANTSAASSTAITVDSLPVISSLSASPTSVTSGGTFGLTANSVTDTGSSVNSVKFYLESNGTSGLQIGSDTLLGSGSQSGINWTLSGLSANGFTAGTYTLYAVATDPTGASSPVVSTTLTVTPGAPTIGSLAVSPTSVMEGTAVSLSASNVTEAGGTISSVAFYRESNGTSGLQIGSDTFLGDGTQSSTTWTLGNVSTTGLAAGTYTYYAVATDSNNASGSAASTTLTVTPPPQPLANIYILASASPNGPFTSNLSVTAGETIYYEVVGQLAPVGTSNDAGTKNYTITSETAHPGVGTTGYDGIQSINFGLSDNGGFQVAFGTDALAANPSTGDNWGAGLGTTGGTVSGATVSNIDAALPSGVFGGATAAESILTGSFVLPATVSSGSTSTIAGVYSSSTTATSGLAINSNPTTGSGATKIQVTSGDPYEYFGFTPLTLKVVVPSLPSWLTVSSGGQVTWNQSAETLEIVSGTATIVADPNESTFNSGAGDEPVITVDNGATLNIAPTDGSLMVHIGGLTLASGATAVVQQLQGPSTYDQMIGEFVASSDASNHEVLVVGKLGAANDPTFSIDPNSTLNMENNDLIIHTGSNDAGGYNELAYVQGLAYGSPFGTGVGGRAGGAWNGKGLTSSVAQAQDYSDGNESVQLAVVDNTDLGSPFNTTSNKYSVGSASEGLNPNGDIIVKYTYTGDFNLAGSVTSADVNIFGLYYDAGSSTGNEWAYGDTNNDGKLNATDANILGLEYGNGTSNGTDPYQL